MWIKRWMGGEKAGLEVPLSLVFAAWLGSVVMGGGIVYLEVVRIIAQIIFLWTTSSLELVM